MSNAKYVVFDGMDGSGKGTQIKMLQDLLGDLVVFTREPGGTPYAEKIRTLVRDDPMAAESTALNNLLLFFAAREELMHNLVMPTLGGGKHVFSDRGDSSTWAFQLYGERHRELKDIFKKLRTMMFLMQNRRPPDLYVIFDLPAEVARERAMADAGRGPLTHFDVRDLAYYERVRSGFQSLAYLDFPVVMIDATRSPQEVHRCVLMELVMKQIIPELCTII